MTYPQMGTPSHDILLKMMDYWKPWNPQVRNDLTRKFAPFPGGVPELLHDVYAEDPEKAWVRCLSPVLNLQENYAYYVYRLHFDRNGAGRDRLASIAAVRSTYFKQRSAMWQFMRTVIGKVVVGVSRKNEREYVEHDEDDMEDTKATNLQAHLLDPLIEEGDGEGLIRRMISHLERLYSMQGPSGMGFGGDLAVDLKRIQAVPMGDLHDFLEDFAPKHHEAWRQQCLVEAEQALDVLSWLVSYLLQKTESSGKKLPLDVFATYFLDLLACASKSGFGMPAWTKDTSHQAVMELKWTSLFCQLLSTDDILHFSLDDLHAFHAYYKSIMSQAVQQAQSIPLVRFVWNEFLRGQNSDTNGKDAWFGDNGVRSRYVVQALLGVVEDAMGPPRTTHIETIFKPELYCDEIPAQETIHRSCILEGYREGHELLKNLVQVTTSISEVIMCEDDGSGVGASCLLAPAEEHRHYGEQLALARLIRTTFRGDQELAEQHAHLYATVANKWYPRMQLGDDYGDHGMDEREDQDQDERSTYTTENADLAIASISGLAVNQDRSKIFVAAFHTLSITDRLVLVTREVDRVTVRKNADGAIERCSLGAFNLVPYGTLPTDSIDDAGGDFVQVRWPLRNTLMDVFLERLFMQPSLILSAFQPLGKPHLVSHYLGLLDDALRLFLALVSPNQAHVDTVLVICNRAQELEHSCPGAMRRLHGSANSHRPEAVVVELLATQALDACQLLHRDELTPEHRRACHEILALVLVSLKQLATLAFWDVKDYLRDFSESVEFTDTVRRVLLHQLCAGDLLNHIDMITHINVMGDASLVVPDPTTQPFKAGVVGTFDLVLQTSGLIRTLVPRSTALDGVDILARFFCVRVNTEAVCSCDAATGTGWNECTCRTQLARDVAEERLKRVMRADSADADVMLSELFGSRTHITLAHAVRYFHVPREDSYSCPKLRGFCCRICPNVGHQANEMATMRDHHLLAVRFAFQVLKYVDSGLDHGQYLRTEVGCKLAEGALSILQEVLGLAAPTMLVHPSAEGGVGGGEAGTGTATAARDGLDLGPVNSEVMSQLQNDGSLRRSLLRLALAPSLSAFGAISTDSSEKPMLPVKFLNGIMGVIGIDPNKIEELSVSAMVVMDRVINLELLHSTGAFSGATAQPTSRCAMTFFERVDVDSDDAAASTRKADSAAQTATYITALCGLVDYPDLPGMCKYVNALPKAALKLFGTVMHSVHGVFQQEAVVQALGSSNVAPFAQSVAGMLTKSVKEQRDSYVGQAAFTLDMLTLLARYQPMTLGTFFSIRAAEDVGASSAAAADADSDSPLMSVLGPCACSAKDGVIVKKVMGLIEMVLHEGEDSRDPTNRDSFQLVQHLALELVMVMSEQEESASLREASRALLTHEKFWPAVVRRVAAGLPPDPVIPCVGAEDLELTKTIMNYTYAVRASASALHFLALQQRRGCISVLSDDDHAVVSARVQQLLAAELRSNQDLWKGWIGRFSHVVDNTDTHTKLSREAAANLGLDLEGFVWAQTHNIAQRIGATVRPLAEHFTTVGRYVYDCQMICRFTDFLPSPEEVRSGEMPQILAPDMEGSGVGTSLSSPADSSLKLLTDYFLERVNCLNCAWAVIDARSKLLSNVTQFMVLNVQPTEGIDGGSGGGYAAPGTPLHNSHVGHGHGHSTRSGSFCESPGDSQGSSFTGDNRSYAVLKTLLNELASGASTPVERPRSADGATPHPVEQSMFEAETRDPITTVKASILEQKTRLLKDMFYHQVQEIRTRRLDPSMSDTRPRLATRLSRAKKDEFVGDCLRLLRTRCLDVHVSPVDGNPVKCETMRRVAVLNLLTCVMLLWGSLRDADWRALPDPAANAKWMHRRVEVFTICRGILTDCLDAQGQPVYAGMLSSFGGQDKSWVMINTALRLVRLVLPSPAELSANTGAHSDIHLMSIDLFETWRALLSPLIPDHQPFCDTIMSLVHRLSMVPTARVQMEHDMHRWDDCTGADKAGCNSASLRAAVSVPDAATAAMRARSSDPCTQLHCLGTALEITAALCVPGGLVDVRTVGPAVLKMLTASDLLQAYRDATATGGQGMACLMPYSTVTCEVSVVTEVWMQTLRLVGNVVSTMMDTVGTGTGTCSGDATSGPYVRSVCGFLSAYSSLIMLPIRPCSSRYSLGQLRLAEASMKLLLHLHPKRSGAAEAATPIWSVLLPAFVNEAYDRVRAMVRAVALLMGDGDLTSSGVDFHTYHLDKKAIAVSVGEKAKTASAAGGHGNRRGGGSRSRGDSGASHASPNFSTGDHDSRGDAAVNSNSVGSPGGLGLGGELGTSTTAPAPTTVKSKFLSAVEEALLQAMLPATMLLARVAATQELREAHASDTPVAAAAMPPDSGGQWALATYDAQSADDGDLCRGLYPVGTELWFFPDSGGSSSSGAAQLQRGTVIRRSLIHMRGGGHGGCKSQALEWQHSGKSGMSQVLTDSIQGSLDGSRLGHSHSMSMSQAMQLHGGGAGGASTASGNALGAYTGGTSAYDAAAAEGCEGGYHVQGPEGGDAAVVRSSQIAYTTPPLLPLKDSAQLKHTADAAVLASDTSVHDDPCTTAHMLRLAQYALSRTAADHLRDAQSDDASVEGRKAATKLLDAIGGNACLAVTSVLKLLSRVRSQSVLEATQKQVDGVRKVVLHGACMDRQADAAGWRAFADAAKNTIDDEVKRTDEIMSYGHGPSPVKKKGARMDNDDEDDEDLGFADGGPIADDIYDY